MNTSAEFGTPLLPTSFADAQDICQCIRSNDAESRTDRQHMQATLVHELRTPISCIMGMAELLAMDKELTDVHKDKLRIIEQCARQQLQLINDLLEHARLGGYPVKLFNSPTAVRPFLQELMASHHAHAAAHGLQLEVQVDARVPTDLLCDQVRLRQILDNLLSNAIKYSSSGTVCIDAALSTRPSAMDASQHLNTQVLEFRVIDQGRGISAEDLAKAGELFARFDEAHNNPPGHGIGLHVTRKLCHLMGTHLDIASKLGHGTTASFALPLQQPLAESASL